MIYDSRLSGVLHVLLHIAEREEAGGGPSTSEALARAMQTNPVVIRRIMAGLREDGLVRSGKGHGGGWQMARDLGAVTLRDVYDALGAPRLLAIGNRTDNPQCLVEKAVNKALGGAFDAAEALLLERFGEVTLAQLSADFRAGMKARGGTTRIEDNHAE